MVKAMNIYYDWTNIDGFQNINVNHIMENKF